MFLAGLQLYFILMNWTVELSYCSAPITEDSDCFLCPETVEFCTAHNPLFLARPEWLRLATCFWRVRFSSGTWLYCEPRSRTAGRSCAPHSLFIGAKMYALIYYHTMEFTSETPPQGSTRISELRALPARGSSLSAGAAVGSLNPQGAP